jgi:hypothetical protein
MSFFRGGLGCIRVPTQYARTQILARSSHVAFWGHRLVRTLFLIITCATVAIVSMFLSAVVLDLVLPPGGNLLWAAGILLLSMGILGARVGAKLFSHFYDPREKPRPPRRDAGPIEASGYRDYEIEKSRDQVLAEWPSIVRFFHGLKCLECKAQLCKMPAEVNGSKLFGNHVPLSGRCSFCGRCGSAYCYKCKDYFVSVVNNLYDGRIISRDEYFTCRNCGKSPAPNPLTQHEKPNGIHVNIGVLEVLSRMLERKRRLIGDRHRMLDAFVTNSPQLQFDLFPSLRPELKRHFGDLLDLSPGVLDEADSPLDEPRLHVLPGTLLDSSGHAIVDGIDDRSARRLGKPNLETGRLDRASSSIVFAESHDRHEAPSGSVSASGNEALKMDNAARASTADTDRTSHMSLGEQYAKECIASRVEDRKTKNDSNVR